MTCMTAHSSNGFTAELLNHGHGTASVCLYGSEAQIAKFALAMGKSTLEVSIWSTPGASGLNCPRIRGLKRSLMSDFLRAQAQLGLVGGIEGKKFAASL